MANKPAQKPDDKPQRMEIKKRTPQKSSGIFDNIGQSRGTGEHPIRELLVGADRTDSTHTTEGTDGSQAKIIALPTEGTDSTATERTDTTHRTQTTEPTDGITHTTEGGHTEHTVGTERKVIRSASIAPDRNYQKVSNLVTKLAIPDGVFKPGKSLELYLKLHELTRGAVVAKRKIRIPRKQLMKAAGIGSDKTIDSILADFKNKGIIAETSFEGQHAGKEYEVFTPEEWPNPSTLGSAGTVGNLPQKLVYVPTVESTYSTDTITAENTTTSPDAKTLFKDSLKPDDEKRLNAAIKKLVRAGREATGKEMTSADWAAFGELVDLFIDETTTAQTRTDFVSSYMKFGVENLRRRLYAKREDSGKAVKRFEPGHGDIPEPLTDVKAKQLAGEYRAIVEAERDAAAIEIPEADREEWARVVGHLRGNSEQYVFDNWFGRLELSSIDRDSHKIRIISDDVTSEWIAANYSVLMNAALDAAELHGFAIEWVPRREGSEEFRARYTPEEWMKISLFI